MTYPAFRAWPLQLARGPAIPVSCILTSSMYALRLMEPYRKAHFISSSMTVKSHSTAAESSSFTVVKLRARAKSSPNRSPWPNSCAINLQRLSEVLAPLRLHRLARGIHAWKGIHTRPYTHRNTPCSSKIEAERLSTLLIVLLLPWRISSPTPSLQDAEK